MLLKILIRMVLAFMFKQWFIFHPSLLPSKAVPCEDTLLPNMVSNCQFSFQALVMDLKENNRITPKFQAGGFIFMKKHDSSLLAWKSLFLQECLLVLLSLAQRNAKLLKLLGWSLYLSKFQFCPCREGQMINPGLFPLQLQVFPKGKFTVKQARNWGTEKFHLPSSFYSYTLKHLAQIKQIYFK